MYIVKNTDLRFNFNKNFLYNIVQWDFISLVFNFQYIAFCEQTIYSFEIPKLTTRQSSSDKAVQNKFTSTIMKNLQQKIKILQQKLSDIY